MKERTIVVTGAGSYLGRRVVCHLLQQKAGRIVAVVSQRNSTNLWDGAGSQPVIIQADLTQRLPEALARELASAHRIFHFAWRRGVRAEEVEEANGRMIHSLMSALAEPARFFFISSVAGTPHARSIYGRAKFHASETVKKMGASSLVLGMVMDTPPAGPYAMLAGWVRKLPCSLRWSPENPRVYPLAMEDLLRALDRVLDLDLAAGKYKVFSPSLGLNEFLPLLEEVFSVRKHFRVTLSPSFVLSAAAFFQNTHLGFAHLCDKIQTFFFKEPAVLEVLLPIPEFAPRAIEQFIKGKGA